MQTETEKILNNHFFRMGDNIREIYNQFYIRQWLISPGSTGYFKKFYFLNTTIDALLKSFIIDLAKFYDQKGDISFYFILKRIEDRMVIKNIEDRINSKNKNIEKLKIWRDKFFAHEDKITIATPKEFMDNNQLSFPDLEELMKFTMETLNEIGKIIDGGISFAYEQHLPELKEKVVCLVSYLNAYKK